MKQLLLIALLFISLSACRDKTENNNPITPTNNPPNTPSNPTPAENSTNIGRFITLRWTGGDPDASDTVKYDIVMGTVNPPVTVVESNTTATIIDVGLVAANTVYYWRVTAKDNHNSFSEGPVWKFTTGN
jgi:hypothetical protein